LEGQGEAQALGYKSEFGVEHEAPAETYEVDPSVHPHW
jgi:hypothetical protein